jgi:hypothetical protein
VQGTPSAGKNPHANMTLAKELLEKGQREAVLTYLQSKGKFWKMGGDELQSCTANIKGGGNLTSALTCTRDIGQPINPTEPLLHRDPGRPRMNYFAQRKPTNSREPFGGWLSR